MSYMPNVVVFAVDWVSLNYDEVSYAAVLGGICAVLGSLIGLLFRNKIAAGSIGAGIGAVAGVVCSRLYGTACLPNFLIVGTLCGASAAYKQVGQRGT
jgi:hypothetical protein